MEKVLFLDSPMKEKPYGSMRIQEKFGFGPMDKKIGEYWAISAHDNGLSKIKNGKYKGETLKDVYLNHRELFANDPHNSFLYKLKSMKFKNHAPYKSIQMMHMLENKKKIMVRLNSAVG